MRSAMWLVLAVLVMVAAVDASGPRVVGERRVLAIVGADGPVSITTKATKDCNAVSIDENLACPRGTDINGKPVNCGLGYNQVITGVSGQEKKLRYIETDRPCIASKADCANNNNIINHLEVLKDFDYRKNPTPTPTPK